MYLLAGFLTALETSKIKAYYACHVLTIDNGLVYCDRKKAEVTVANNYVTEWSKFHIILIIAVLNFKNEYLLVLCKPVSNSNSSICFSSTLTQHAGKTPCKCNI